MRRIHFATKRIEAELRDVIKYAWENVDGATALLPQKLDPDWVKISRQISRKHFMDVKYGRDSATKSQCKFLFYAQNDAAIYTRTIYTKNTWICSGVKHLARIQHITSIPGSN